MGPMAGDDSRTEPPGWRPSFGHRDESIRSPPTRSAYTVGLPDRSPRKKTADTAHKVRTTFSASAKARGRRGGRPSPAALLLKAVQNEDEGERAGDTPKDLPETEQLDFSSQILEMVAGMYGSAESGDVVLHSHAGLALHAHRGVLAGWSRVLRAELCHSDRHALDLPYEGDPAVLDSMLRSFYIGQVDVDVSEGGTATVLLAISLAYDVPALVTRLAALLDASRGREYWWGELQEKLGEVHGDGSMDDMWQRAEHLGQKPPDAVDRRTTEYIQSGRLRINLRAEVARATAAMFNDSPGPAASDENFSDATLSVPVDGRAAQEFKVHRAVLGYWSGVLQSKLLQEREQGLHRVAHRPHRACKVNLEFRLRSHDVVGGGVRETAVVHQLLHMFYTGLLQLSSTENAHELLQAAVAFEVPTVERAARTWLMARGGHDQPTVASVLSVPPQLEPLPRLGSSQVAVQAQEGEQAWNSSLSSNPLGRPEPQLLVPDELDAQLTHGTSASDDTVDSHLEDVYRRLDPSGHGLSLHEVEDAIREIAPDLFSSDDVEQGHEQEILLRGDESMGRGIDHGIDFHKAAKGGWIISGIKPGSLAAAEPKLQTGMQVLKMDNKRIDVDVRAAAATDQLHHQLARKLASGNPVKLTVKARKSSVRDWSVEERRKALHWAYRAADEHGDGWISLSEFVHFHAYLRYVYDNFMEIQRVLDQVGFRLTFTNFQRACSMIQHTHGTRKDFEELCRLPTAIAADVASSRDFVTWAIRTNAGEKQTRLATDLEFTFDQPGSSGITFVCRTNEERGVETAVIKSIQQGSEAEAHPGLRVGMILTSISSPALSAKQKKSERFLNWLSGDDVDAVAQMADGAPHRIKQLHKLERARLREVCMKNDLLTKGSHIGWDGLCDLGFKAVDNLLKQLFSTDGSHPITLGFAAGQQTLLFPGKKRCDDTFHLVSHSMSFVSLRALEEALPSLFSHRAGVVTHKTLIQAYRAADICGDGGLSKDEFCKCVQCLVYIHNNAHELQSIEEDTEDRRHTLEDFKKNSLLMGEHLTHVEAVAEFTKCAEEEMTTTETSRLQQNEHARDGYTISYEMFCTWLARRASLRMLSEAATPHRIHEVSHSGAAARTVRLTMPAKGRIRTIFDVQPGRITFSQVEQKLSKAIVVKVVTELFPEAHKRRLARVAGYARSAAFERVEHKDDPYRTFAPEEQIALSEQILRYMIAIDDVWDRVSQEVQHTHGTERPSGGTAACCAAPQRAKSVISEVMSETNFIQACNVAGYYITPQQAAQDFRELCQGSNKQVALDEFCVWIAPKIQDSAGLQKQTQIDSSKFTEYSGGREFISVAQVRRLAGRRDAVLDAALAICQSEHETVWEHEFHQVVQALEFLDHHCVAVARLLAHDGDGSPQVNLGDFRRCCDLVGHHMSEVEVSRQFGQFGMGPEGRVDAKDFYVWFARQEIAKSLKSRRPEMVRLPLLVLPPKSRAMSIAKGLADPVNRCLTWSEVQRAAAELLPEVRGLPQLRVQHFAMSFVDYQNHSLARVLLLQFQFRDEILSVAFQLAIDEFAPGELVQAEELEHLLIDVSRLFRWWATLQGVRFPIPRKDFWAACLLIDSDIRREESATYFDRFQESTDSDHRHMSKQSFCAWILKHTGTGGEQAAAQGIDMNAAFDRYSQDGAVDHRNISKLSGALHPNLHPHFRIVAHKAAEVNGKARISRESCGRLDRCIRHFKSIQDDLRSLYGGQELFQLDTAVEMNKRLYKNQDAVLPDIFNRFWADNTPAANSKKETDSGGVYVTFGDFCCWSAQQQSRQEQDTLIVGQQLSPRNTTSKSASSLQALSPKALYKLGMQYMRGEHPVPKNAESAVSCFRAAADRRHALSQRVLGECLMAGDGVSKDPTQAAYYYQLAAVQGDTIAQAHLGVCYLTGDGVDRDLDEAVRLFRAAGNDPVAQFNLGVCYAKGEGVCKDVQKAVEYYERSAKQRLVEAQCNLGECLMKGDGVPKNSDRAVELFMLAAKRGLPAAQFNLGVCYSRGEGVKVDGAAALHYYRLAADRNHARAKDALERTEQQVQTKEASTQFYHGKLLLEQWRQTEFTDRKAQSEHLAECIRCFDSSAELGHHDARYELALLYRAGAGHLTKSDEEAYRLAKPAADAHHRDAAFLCAQLRLVHWYTAASGRHIFDEALYYFTVAAESENYGAQFILGYILLCQACEIDDQLCSLAASMQQDFTGYDVDHIDSSGGGNSYFIGGSVGRYGRDSSTRYSRGGSIGDVGHDGNQTVDSVAAFGGSELHDLNWPELLVVDVGAVEKAKHWFARATEGGNVQAMIMLAELYLHGCGIAQSDLEALDWFRLAADHNDVVSLCKQAWMMIKGTACNQDFDEAERLFEDALKVDEDCLEAKLAYNHFADIRECARRSRGDYNEFLKDLFDIAPRVHRFALGVASEQTQARPVFEEHRPLLEEEIRAEESKKNRLSAQASELRERAEYLDAHRTQEQPRLPRHILLISRRLPALQLLLDSVSTSVATIECDEADDPDDIEDQVRTTVADAKHTWSATRDRTESGNREDFRLDSIVLISKGGELNELVPRMRGACADLRVEHFDEDTWSRHTAMFADRAGDYFDAEKHVLWRQAAEKHALLEEEKMLKAAGRVSSAQKDARRAEKKLLEDEDKRQQELRLRRDQRRRRQEEHGVSRPWGEQHDPALAVCLDDDNPDDVEPSLFGQPLLSCSRQMSSQEGLDRLPRAIEVCAEYVRNKLGTTDADVLADLFKMPHNLDVVKKLTAKLDCVDLTNLELEQLGLNILDVAWVIVTWLTELPQPLLSTPLPGGDSEEMFQRIQRVGLHAHDNSSQGSSEARAISDLKQLLDRLPADHYAILAFVMQLLHDAEREYARSVVHDVNVDAKRASLILTPALVRQPTGSERQTTRLNHRVVAVMIEHFDLVFWEQKLYPGIYSIEGHVSSIDARGTLVLTDSHRVEGYLAVCPCIEQRESPHPASWMVRHIMDGGTWGMDGKISFPAR